LLETLRLENGVFRNLDAHLARLQRAAKHFAHPFDEAHIRRVLNDVVTGKFAWRVRLLLDVSGKAQAQAFALPPSPTLVTLRLAGQAFEEAHSEFTRFKTTHRAHYETLAPTDPAVFDTLLYNTAGELTECTRGNIALLLDGRWVTPPLRCGLLDGIGREFAIKEGRLHEAVVRLEDLPRVQAFAFVNSLRGWLDARLI